MTVQPHLSGQQISDAYRIVAALAALQDSDMSIALLIQSDALTSCILADAVTLAGAVETEREARQQIADAEQALADAKAAQRALQTLADLESLTEGDGIRTFYGARNGKRVKVSRLEDGGYAVSAYQHRDDIDGDDSPARTLGGYAAESVSTVAEIVANGFHAATV